MASLSSSKSSPLWKRSGKSFIWVFNVGRGLCAFIRTGINHGILYDIGCSAEFKPSDFLKDKIIPHLDQFNNCHLAQVVLSHPHTDHIYDIECMHEPSISESSFYAHMHTCPYHEKPGAEESEHVDFDRIQSQPGTEDKVDKYKELYTANKRNPPLQTVRFPFNEISKDIEYGLFYVRPPVVASEFPKDDSEYGNGISILLYYRHKTHNILLTGDINPTIMDFILNDREGVEKRYSTTDRTQLRRHPLWHKKNSGQISLRGLLGDNGLSILVAPHHGLESGFSDNLFKSIKGEKAGLVVISDKRKRRPNDGDVDDRYSKEEYVIGQEVEIDGKTEEERRSVSTKNGHHILIELNPNRIKPQVFLDKEPDELLAKMN